MTTRELNQILNHSFNIPVSIRNNTFPNNQPYAAISNLSVTGFSFTGKELLHSIGCKIASLPASNRDESIRAAQLYAHLLDFEGPYLGYKPTVEIDSDLQTNRSNEIGIGIGCLIASKHFNVNWDTLEPIKGKGKRFDYRATDPNQNYAYEFKGTKHRGKQREQIDNGLSKKADMHSRNERYDVELIISAHLNYSNVEPRIILADPPFEGYKNEFTEQADLFYRLRHYSRIAQFIGDIPLSRALYLQSQFVRIEGDNVINTDQIDDLGFTAYKAEKNAFYNPRNEERILKFDIGNSQFTGRWISDWLPEIPPTNRITYNLPVISPNQKLEIFQGVTDDLYNVLISTESEKIRALKKNDVFLLESQNVEYNRFDDGTVMSYRMTDV